MTPTIAKLALDWVAAERADAARRGVEMDPIPKEDELAIAADRVYLVMAGEVPWSQCSPGDRAIWRGRFRDIQLFEQLWNDDDRQWLRREAEADGPRRGRNVRRVGGTAAGAGAVRPNYPSPQYPGGPPAPAQPIQGYQGLFGGDAFAGDQARTRRREIQWRDQIFYDTLTATDIIEWKGPRIRMFGSAHIGQQHLCNLSFPRALSPRDSTHHILGIWIWPSTTEGLLHIANRWLFTLGMGEMPHFGPIHARDLFQGYVFQRPIVLPVRQSIHVEVDRGDDRLTTENEPAGDLWDVTFCMQVVSKWERQ